MKNLFKSATIILSSLLILSTPSFATPEQEDAVIEHSLDAVYSYFRQGTDITDTLQVLTENVNAYLDIGNDIDIKKFGVVNELFKFVLSMNDEVPSTDREIEEVRSITKEYYNMPYSIINNSKALTTLGTMGTYSANRDVISVYIELVNYDALRSFDNL